MKIGSSIKHAIKVKALRQLAREIGIAEAVSALTAIDDRTPRERAATARQSRRSAVVAEYERLKRLGHGRGATAMTVAKFAAKDDPVEQQSLARNIRRWRRRITDTVRSPSEKSD